MKSKHIHILLLSPFFYPHIGGSQRYMEELAFHLMKKHPEIHIDILCYNTMNATSFEIYRGMSIYRVPCQQIIAGQFILPKIVPLLTMLFALAKKKYDVIYSNTRFFDTTWWGWIYARYIRAISIVTDHVANHPLHENFLINVMSKIIDHSLAKWSLRKYDMVTVTNNETKKFLEKHLKLNRPVQIEYGGVDTRFFSPMQKKSRVVPQIKKLFKSNDIIVTYTGRLIWSKGVMHLFDAIVKILQNHTENIYFIIAGNGPLEKILREKIRLLHLDNHVFFTGGLSVDKIRDTLRATDIFVYPTHHSEGLPNSILEAGACNCFVLTTHNAGTDLLIQHNHTGIFIEKENTNEIGLAITWAIKHPKERKKMAKNLRIYIRKNFDWKKISNHFYHTFNKIVHS